MFVTPQSEQDFLLQRMRARRACYESPHDASGEPLGPLVGYSKTYDPAELLHYVGFGYFNFAKVEGTPDVLHFANNLAAKIIKFGVPDGICGSPMGGLAISAATTSMLWENGHHEVEYHFPDELVTVLKTETTRKKTIYMYGRHEVLPGKHYMIGEDTYNSGGSSTKMAEAIEALGGIVDAIICAVDRAWPGTSCLEREGHAPIPKLSAIYLPTAQYRQDAPEVATFIASGNVVWDPKKEWAALEAAMTLAL